MSSSGEEVDARDTDNSSVSWDGLTQWTTYTGGDGKTYFRQPSTATLNYHYTKSYSSNGIQSASTHELGHAMGLGHASGCVIMNATTSSRYGKLRRLHPKGRRHQRCQPPVLTSRHDAEAVAVGRGRKRWAATMVTATAAVSVCAGCGSQASQTHTETGASWANAYPSVDAMGRHADAIIVGRVSAVAGTGVDKFSGTSTGAPYTDFKVSVLRWIAGAAPQRDVLVHQTGSRSGAQTTAVQDDPLLSVGEQDVLFLHQYKPGHYFVLGGPTGRFNVRNNVVSALPAGIARDGLPQQLTLFTTRASEAFAATHARGSAQ